jgi:hypothetical protein
MALFHNALQKRGPSELYHVTHPFWERAKNFLIPKSKFEAGIFKKRVLDAWLVWRESNDIQGMHYVGDILSYDDIDVALTKTSATVRVILMF